ncbi:MAG: hypothetical protein JWM80_2295 [Cyanobacteria bacterium RYN_339]|nr:hypothetical protein [Cyanobacteria bacterium RYN_339]
MSLASKLGQEITTKAGKRLSQKAVDRASKEVVSKAAKEVAGKAAKEVAGKAAKEAAAKAGKKAASQVAGDVLIKSGAKAAEAANPLLEATLSVIQAQIKEKGAFTAHVIDELQMAVTQANTPAEAIRVAELAKKLAFKNDANKGAILSGLQRAIEKSSLTDEALTTLKAVVKTRQDCYALFSLSQKRGITFDAVNKLMRSGEEETVTNMAIHVIPKPVFGPRPPHFNTGVNELKKTLEEKIESVARYLNSALR